MVEDMVCHPFDVVKDIAASILVILFLLDDSIWEEPTTMLWAALSNMTWNWGVLPMASKKLRPPENGHRNESVSENR